jgi:hypothetical protein
MCASASLERRRGERASPRQGSIRFGPLHGEHEHALARSVHEHLHTSVDRKPERVVAEVRDLDDPLARASREADAAALALPELLEIRRHPRLGVAAQLEPDRSLGRAGRARGRFQATQSVNAERWTELRAEQRVGRGGLQHDARVARAARAADEERERSDGEQVYTAPMRTVRNAAIALFVVLGAAFALAVARLDAEALRRALVSGLESRLGQPVELGRVELSLFPLPALRASDARIGVAPARLDARELRAGVALLALLVGRVELRDLRVRHGRIALGGLALEELALDAELDGEIGFSAEARGIGRLADGRLELAQPAQTWTATARIEDADLSAFDPLLSGVGRGTLAARGGGVALERVTVTVESEVAALRARDVAATGRVKISGTAGGPYALDLGAATLRIADRLEKPPGVPFRLESGRVESAALRGAVALATDALDIRSAELDLDALAREWRVPDGLPRSGSLQIEEGRWGGPRDFAGSLALSGVELAHAVRVSGRAIAREGRFQGDALRVEIGGEPLAVSAEYDARENRLALTATATGPRLAPIVEALWGRRDVSGRLYARIEAAGRPDPYKLFGTGEFELLDGELPGVSLARAAGLDHTLDEPPGLDRLDRLAGRFVLEADSATFEELTLAQRDAFARVQGRISLRDGVVDLNGEVSFTAPDGQGEVVRPILRMAGPLGALETHVSDAQTDEVREMERQMIEAMRKAEGKPPVATPPVGSGAAGAP